MLAVIPLVCRSQSSYKNKPSRASGLFKSQAYFPFLASNLGPFFHSFFLSQRSPWGQSCIQSRAADMRALPCQRPESGICKVLSGTNTPGSVSFKIRRRLGGLGQPYMVDNKILSQNEKSKTVPECKIKRIKSTCALRSVWAEREALIQTGLVFLSCHPAVVD